MRNRYQQSVRTSVEYSSYGKTEYYSNTNIVTIPQYRIYYLSVTIITYIKNAWNLSLE